MQVLLSILLAVLAQAGGAQAGREPVILNYWTHLKTILDSDEAHRRTRTMRPTGEFIVRVHYPFDHVMHMRPGHLLQAAREGIDEARTAAWGQDEALAQRDAYRNAAKALEYYPLLAREDADLRALLHVMGRDREDPVLRAFLMERIVPGLAPPSLFSRYLAAQVARQDRQAIHEAILPSATMQRADPLVQGAAIRALFAYDRQHYTELLRGDPQITGFARRERVPLGPSLLLREDTPEPAGDIAKQVENMNRQWTEIAEKLVRLLDPALHRPPETRALVRDHLERIASEFPVANASAIQAALDRNPVEDGAAR